MRGKCRELGLEQRKRSARAEAQVIPDVGGRERTGELMLEMKPIGGHVAD
jgi:hypothetical protein